MQLMIQTPLRSHKLTISDTSNRPGRKPSHLQLKNKRTDGKEQECHREPKSFYHAALAEFELRNQNKQIAAQHFRAAFEIARNSMERTFLDRRIAAAQE